MKVSEHFTKELSYIKNATLRRIVAETLDNSPECIVEIPASSSGKYHPAYTTGFGGLMRHIKAAVAIGFFMIETDIFGNRMLGFDFKEQENYKQKLDLYADAAYAAIILHDCKKPDDTPKHGTKFNHPLLAADSFKEVARKHINKDNMEYMKVVVPMIHNAIASHMGQWTTATYAKGIVLPAPATPIQLFVHECDFLASRKPLIFDFDVYEKG